MSDKIKLSEWAQKNGITYQTAYRWYRADKLPCKSITQTPTGTILVEELDETDTKDLIPPNEKTIVQHLVSAYRKIQQQQSKEEKEVQAQRDLTEKEGGKVHYDDVSCQEKQEILKGFGFGKDEQPDLLKKITKRDKLTIDDKLELIHKDIEKISTDTQTQDADLKQIMSNLFGDDKTVYERFKKKVMYEVGKQIHSIFKGVKDMSSLKSTMDNLETAIKYNDVENWNKPIANKEDNAKIKNIKLVEKSDNPTTDDLIQYIFSVEYQGKEDDTVQALYKKSQKAVILWVVNAKYNDFPGAEISNKIEKLIQEKEHNG